MTVIRTLGLNKYSTTMIVNPIFWKKSINISWISGSLTIRFDFLQLLLKNCSHLSCVMWRIGRFTTWVERLFLRANWTQGPYKHTLVSILTKFVSLVKQNAISQLLDIFIVFRIPWHYSRDIHHKTRLAYLLILDF